MDKPTMIVGIDVVHLVGKEKSSIVGFAASMDRYISKYYIDSVYKAYNPKHKLQDITFELEPLFQQAIIKFKEQCGVPPQRIIVYRDSQSEGQYSRILQKEVSQLRQAIEKLKLQGGVYAEEDKPSFIFMITNKKIEQRFCESNGRLYNPTQGLVIEDEQICKGKFQFYLIPHSGPTGLQCPMKFDVISLENFVEADGTVSLNPKDLYDLTFNLSFGFFNYQNSIKLPGPLMYAHTLCNQMKKIVGKNDLFEIQDNFKDKLFCI